MAMDLLIFLEIKLLVLVDVSDEGQAACVHEELYHEGSLCRGKKDGRVVEGVGWMGMCDLDVPFNHMHQRPNKIGDEDRLTFCETDSPPLLKGHGRCGGRDSVRSIGCFTPSILLAALICLTTSCSCCDTAKRAGGGGGELVEGLT
jgi:hypothetical protein